MTTPIPPLPYSERDLQVQALEILRADLDRVRLDFVTSRQLGIAGELREAMDFVVARQDVIDGEQRREYRDRRALDAARRRLDGPEVLRRQDRGPRHPDAGLRGAVRRQVDLATRMVRRLRNRLDPDRPPRWPDAGQRRTAPAAHPGWPSAAVGSRGGADRLPTTGTVLGPAVGYGSGVGGGPPMGTGPDMGGGLPMAGGPDVAGGRFTGAPGGAPYGPAGVVPAPYQVPAGPVVLTAEQEAVRRSLVAREVAKLISASEALRLLHDNDRLRVVSDFLLPTRAPAGQATGHLPTSPLETTPERTRSSPTTRVEPPRPEMTNVSPTSDLSSPALTAVGPPGPAQGQRNDPSRQTPATVATMTYAPGGGGSLTEGRRSGDWDVARVSTQAALRSSGYDSVEITPMPSPVLKAAEPTTPAANRGRR
ncbi:hypothetical protein E1091_13860 [Micromonospora fluostatini]|uniref:DUF222 domain-containing protein n=1 Tax=Micromonospora fluostatini TaxID=1629071 RepID=A0ABY2DJN3_9ACTN|nr:hypothetical protein E1091_13860 [Micromonospora fluostatini]